MTRHIHIHVPARDFSKTPFRGGGEEPTHHVVLGNKATGNRKEVHVRATSPREAGEKAHAHITKTVEPGMGKWHVIAVNSLK